MLWVFNIIMIMVCIQIYSVSNPDSAVIRMCKSAHEKFIFEQSLVIVVLVEGKVRRYVLDSRVNNLFALV